MKTRLLLLAFIVLNTYTLNACAYDIGAYIPPSYGYSVNINGGNYQPAYNPPPVPQSYYYPQPAYVVPVLQAYYPQQAYMMPYREHHHHHHGYGGHRGYYGRY